MSRKSMIMIGMVAGSLAGGYILSLPGAGLFSLTSLFGNVAGGIIGIWLAFILTR